MKLYLKAKFNARHVYCHTKNVPDLRPAFEADSIEMNKKCACGKENDDVRMFIKQVWNKTQEQAPQTTEGHHRLFRGYLAPSDENNKSQ